MDMTTDEAAWRRIVIDFKKHNMPYCLGGGIDSKHVANNQPQKLEMIYFNYKNFFSIVLLGVTDTNNCFIFCDIG